MRTTASSVQDVADDERVVLIKKENTCKRCCKITNSLLFWVIASLVGAFGVTIVLTMQLFEARTLGGFSAVITGLESNAALISQTSSLASLALGSSLGRAPCGNASDSSAIASQAIITAFMALTRASPWNCAEHVALQGNVYHPQGIVHIAARRSATAVTEPGFYLLSTVEVLNRTASEGRGWLLKFAENGTALGALRIGVGASYHPGGMDSDGRFVYVPTAEYHPGPGLSIVYRVDPYTLTASELFRFTADHVGALVWNDCYNVLQGVSWGSRTLYTWTLAGTLLTAQRNPNQFVDYQDCKALRGTQLSLCSGVTELPAQDTQTPAGYQLGGLALLHMASGAHVWTLPVTAETAAGTVLTENPMLVQWTDDGGGSGALQFVFAPDNDVGALYVCQCGA